MTEQEKPATQPIPIPEQKELEIDLWGTLDDKPVKTEPKKEEEK